MDCSSHQNHYNQYNDNDTTNWLGFSLSNNIHSSSPHHLSLFQTPFHHLSQSGGDQSHELSILTSSPKLEDFLGGCGEIESAGAPFGCGNQNTSSDTSNLYDDDITNNNDFKTISTNLLHASSPEPVSEPVVANNPDSPPKKAIESFGQRTSIFRGVTRHRWTGRYEAHLWDNSCRREGQSRKGRQVYLGGYDKEERAARAYDLAALKYWGPNTTTNFPVHNYEKELEDMKIMNRQEFVASLRRKSSGFSRGASMYRGVTRHHQHGRWQARIGRVAGNKDLYLGTFSTQEEAAEAYDIAAIKFRGINAVTNFDMSRYDIDSIAISTLPVGPTATKMKTSSNTSKKSKDGGSNEFSLSSSISFALPPAKQDLSDYWSMFACNQQSFPYNTASEGLQGSSHYGMNSFSTTNNEVGYFTSEGKYVTIPQHQSNVDGGTSSSISFGTPVDLNSDINNCATYYEEEGTNNGNFGNWNISFQNAKSSSSNMSSVYQSPIFGME